MKGDIIMSDLFWLTNAQLSKIKPYLPPSCGVPYVCGYSCFETQPLIAGYCRLLSVLLLCLSTVCRPHTMPFIPGLCDGAVLGMLDSCSPLWWLRAQPS